MATSAVEEPEHRLETGDARADVVDDHLDAALVPHVLQRRRDDAVVMDWRQRARAVHHDASWPTSFDAGARHIRTRTNTHTHTHKLKYPVPGTILAGTRVGVSRV